MLVYFFAMAAVLVAVFLVANSAAVFAVLNRDPSFTGRLPLWDMQMQAIIRRPPLGYGYCGFWNQGFLDRAADLAAKLAQRPDIVADGLRS